MAITINGSGTITGISAGGLPDGSVTAADLASGVLPVGKTLNQIVGISGPSSTISGITGSTYVLDCSITPSSTSSQILIMAYGHVIAMGNSNSLASISVTRGGSALWSSGDTNGFHNIYAGDGSNNVNYVPLVATGFDSPNTTSAVTYRLTAARASSGTTSVTAEDNALSFWIAEFV